MRIITGIYKGRRFDIPRTFKARPTTDFAKENLFNVLAGMLSLDGADALDLFSGTGSISLELLSRGCRSVTSVEADRDHQAFIAKCVAKLGAENCTALRADAFRFIKSCRRQYDFIFADPPYALPELPTLPELVLGRGLLRAGGVFVLEHGAKLTFEGHPLLADHRAYGSVNFSIFTTADTPADEAAGQ